MKVIDLLNKIANGEEVPKFKYKDILYEYNEEYKELMSKQKFIRLSDVFEHYFLFEEIDMTNLNDEVEILEEEPKDVEVCGTWFTKTEYDKLTHSEEEKKIPEKLNISNFPRHNNSLKKTAIKVNEIIDYLKSKGE